MADCMWFGTEERMGWIPAPNSGATMSPEGWGVGGVLMSGGGYQANSWGSHKNYVFEWPSASSLEAAQLMKSYSDGTYGRGLIYFIDPLTYLHNVLPARIADPSMAVGDESASLVYGVNPVGVPVASGSTANLPVMAAEYDLSSTPTGFRQSDAIFIPIPEGYTLWMTAYYTATGSGGIFCTPQTGKGNRGSNARLSNSAVTQTSPTQSFKNVDGVWIWVGRTSSAASSVSIQGIVGRLAKTGQPSPKGGWIGGMGHSGTRFAARPTWTTLGATNGGQVGYAASFREVGSWAYA